MVNWWPLKCTGTAEIGATDYFYFGPQYDWCGRVIQYIPNSAFHIKMTKADSDWMPTSFGFDLSRTNGHVQIRFWHKGWPACNTHFRRSSYCWALLLNGLKHYIEIGVVVPFEEME